jgi:hypothetical protein
MRHRQTHLNISPQVAIGAWGEMNSTYHLWPSFGSIQTWNLLASAVIQLHRSRPLASVVERSAFSYPFSDPASSPRMKNLPSAR